MAKPPKKTKKVYKTKPSMKQKKAVGKIVENCGNVSKSMKQAGYSDASAKNPKSLTDSKGFEQLMDEAGLTDDFLNECLEEDIRMKQQKREPELKLAYKLRGRLKDKVDITTKGKALIGDSSRMSEEEIAQALGKYLTQA